MVKKIFNSFISLLLCLLIACPANAQYNNNRYDQRPVATPKEDKKAPEIEYPFYNGINIGVDIWGPGSYLLGSDFFSMEASGIIDLKHRYFPTIEVGYGKSDCLSDEGVKSQSSAPYLRIGMDYNALYKKAHGHMILVGLRYGISPTTYDTSSPSIKDPIYGGEIPAFNHTGMKSTMQWMEIVLGIRAKICKSLHMGWSIRMRYKLAASTGTYGDPYYVPGFGKYDSKTIGVNYSIIYNLPF